MFTHIFLRFRRTPLPALGVLLFAAVLAAVLCGLHAANEAELAHYEEVYQTLPVKLTVTNLKGTKSDDLLIYSWYENAFLSGKAARADLSDYIKDLQRKLTYSLSGVGERPGGGNLVGISSVEICRELWPENGAAISWAPGWDEGCLAGNERVCLIPSGLDSNGDGQEDSGVITLRFEEQAYEFTIAGTVMGSSDMYCPFLTLRACILEFTDNYALDAMSATLRDNSRLEEFRAVMTDWFVEPDPSGMQVNMPGSGYQKYDYALDINDSQLRAASETLEKSLTVNRISTVLVFALSAGAGFFVGFLMIRQRKREIALMRTLGEANARVYGSFALEQMLCVLLGTVLGGAYFIWQPAGRLLLFALIYFVGLTVALILFLRGNLLSAMKEDE